ASILVAAVTGGVSLGMTGDLKKRCPGNVCGPADQSTLDSATALANASTATFVIGGVAAAAGIVLMAVDFGPKAPQKAASRVHVEAWVSIGGGRARERVLLVRH